MPGLKGMTMAGMIQFEFLLGFLLFLPLAAFAGLVLWRERRRGLNRIRTGVLGGLRLITLGLLVFLAARPVWIVREPPSEGARPVVLLVDRSESMSLEEGGQSRYEQAFAFLRDRLLPELKSAGFPVKAMLFDEDAVEVDGQTLGSTVPRGRRTNLANAIAKAAAAEPRRRPLAIIALTDGVANESADNSRALSALARAGAPFIGFGFGSDRGIKTLSLRELDAPSRIPSRTAFSVAARIETMNMESGPAFDLLLYRDGQLRQKKSVPSGPMARERLENFIVTEEKSGSHEYSVRLVISGDSDLKCVNDVASAIVEVSDDRELRVLYVQGALTWDYKFISLALRNDPMMKLTGLTRTSTQSVFRQNVENEGELTNGFPASLDELSPFRVVVLSNLRPADLSLEQQELLAKFCGELGGGILMIGGPATFDASWQKSRLEQLLPVVFSPLGPVPPEHPFRMQPTEEALQDPVFQIAEGRPAKEVWARLPLFTQFGRVDAAKPGAQVWARHQTEDGPDGKRILMASQRYGAGLSAVLCIQNFWRWRLARESDPQEFDRFWRQLFRYLSEVGRQEVAIHLADQDLAPQRDIELVLERQPSPGNLRQDSKKFLVKVENGQQAVLREAILELSPLHPVPLTFRAEKADTYTATVLDMRRNVMSSRSIEIRAENLEFARTARDMETLQQWASASDGLAMKVEDCRDTAELVGRLKAKLSQAREGARTRRPMGLNGWVLALVVGCLAGEWLFRKRWGLI